MHTILIEIDRCTYKKVGELINFYCKPSFQVELQEMETHAYSVLNKFSKKLLNSLDRNDDIFDIMAFKFINALSKSSNLEVLNLLRIGVFEILLDYPQRYEQVYSRLDDDARKIFLKHKQEYFE